MSLALHRTIQYLSRMDEIDKLIAERRTAVETYAVKIAELTRLKEIADAELKAYQRARDYYSRQPSSPEPERTESDAAKTGRALSGVWLETMRGLGHLNTFGVEHVLASAEQRGHAPSKDNIRSQLHNYKGRGLIETLSPGRYQFTEPGLTAFQIDRPRGDPDDLLSLEENKTASH